MSSTQSYTVHCDDTLYWVASDSKSVAEVISYCADTYLHAVDAIDLGLKPGLHTAILLEDWAVASRLANTIKKLAKQ